MDGDGQGVYTWEMTTDESGYQNFTRKHIDEQAKGLNTKPVAAESLRDYSPQITLLKDTIDMNAKLLDKL